MSSRKPSVKCIVQDIVHEGKIPDSFKPSQVQTMRDEFKYIKNATLGGYLRDSRKTRDAGAMLVFLSGRDRASTASDQMRFYS